MKKLTLTQSEVEQLKELIYDEIDKQYGFENINDDLKSILSKICDFKFIKTLTIE